MKILFTIASDAPQFGGPSRSVPALANALRDLDVEVELIVAENADSAPSNKLQRYARFVSDSAFRTQICSKLPGANLLHDHGIWLPTNHTAVRAARTAGIPYVISPRGMLSPWALGAGRWRKRLAWFAYQGQDLRRAACLHATSEQEAGEFRAIGLDNPVTVIPNGIEIPSAEELSKRAELNGQPPPERRTILFFSRIHPKKGLLDLVAAWVRTRPTGWQIVVAGPDEGGHQREVETAASQAGIRNDFQFVGPITDQRKWDFYARADLFVLPSYSENFGIVIGEALAAGLPVITTKATPWEDLERHRCGWWIPTGAETLAAALHEATSLPRSQLREMGQRGRLLIAGAYSWEAVGKQMLESYVKTLEKGESAGPF